MSEKTCVSCGVNNPSDFTYCKYCGAMLPAIDKFPKEEPASEEEKHRFGEVSYFEYRRFIGNGADNILYDFELLDKGRKFVFSLPVLFLGFVFGFYGLSAWFFYRKLKKTALILLLIAVISSAFDAFLNAGLNQTIVHQLSSILGSNRSDQTVMLHLENLVSYYSYYVVNISAYISFFVSFFASAFALRIFKDYSYNKILCVKLNHNEESPEPLDIALKKAGSSSLALGFIPFLCYAVFPIIFFLGSLFI